MVTIIFKLLLLITPIAIWTNSSMDMFDIILFRTGIIVLFMASLVDNPKRDIPKNIIYLILGLLGLCLANVFIYTFHPVVLSNFQNIFLATLGFCIVYKYLDEKQNFKKYILWAGLINLLFFISQRIGFDPILDKRVDFLEVGALLGNKSRLLTYFAVITPFLWTPLLIISATIGIFTGQLVIFIPIIICLWTKLKNNKERIGFLVVLLLAAIVFHHKILYSLLFRFNEAWKPAMIAFFDKSLFGLGLGARVKSNIEFLGNSYLQFIVGVGILGAVWFGYAFKFLYKTLSVSTESIALASLAVIMLIEYPIEMPRLWITLIGIIVLALIKNKEVVNVS